MSRGKFEHGGGDPLIVDGGQVSRTAFQYGGFGAQKVGDVVHAGFVPVLRDAQAFPGFGNGGAGDLDALLGRFEAGVGAPHLQADGGIGALLVEFGALHQVAGFGDAGFVRRSIEEIPAEGNGGQPVGAAAIDEALAIGFECAAES